MNYKKTNPNRRSKFSSSSGNSLQIKIIETKDDVALFTQLARQFHYMGEGCPAGDTLRLAVLEDGKWIALRFSGDRLVTALNLAMNGSAGSLNNGRLAKNWLSNIGGLFC